MIIKPVRYEREKERERDEEWMLSSSSFYSAMAKSVGYMEKDRRLTMVIHILFRIETEEEEEQEGKQIPFIRQPQKNARPFDN